MTMIIRASIARWVFAGILLLMTPGSALATFNDTAIAWSLFEPPTGYTIPYTFNGQPVSDEESSSDKTNGGAAVSPSAIDLASGSPDGTNPGPYDTPTFGYYNGGTVYDPNDPRTYQDDVVRFTMRLVGDPRKSDGFDNYHWNILLDVDGDGYKEFWIDLYGKYSANGFDQLQILYDNSNAQTLPDTPDKIPSLRVNEFRAYSDTDAGNYSHTKARAATDGTGDWFIDIQVPLTAFTDRLGNQVLYPDSPVGFVFSTSASATDPLQKDFMTDLSFLTANDPISFGDVVKPNGDAILYFAGADKKERDYYTVGENIVLYLRDAYANSNPAVVNTTTATVTNPVTGDEETVTLTESGPNTGIFTNLGGASKPASSDGSNAWIPYVTTSEITTSENWTLTYNAGTDRWTVTGSVSGVQPQTAAGGVEYVSGNGQIRFTIYDVAPVNGASVTFTTYAGDRLRTATTAGAVDDGTLQVIGGEIITYSYTQTKTGGVTKTFTDKAQIIGPGTPFIQFTRANGAPTDNFILTSSPATSDKLYVTIYHAASNTNPATVQSITVTLTGDANNPAEAQTLTLVETGPNTGIFRNTTGLNTQVSDGTVTPNDSLWEDIDQGKVTATFTYGGTPYRTTASLFYIIDAGRVNFTNGAGTIGVAQYSADQPIFIQVTDESVTCGGLLTVTVTSTIGDSETVRLYQTAAGSGVYMNRINDLVTTSGSAVVTSASGTFVTSGLAPGKAFIIATGPDTGTHSIASVASNTQLTLTQPLTATLTGIGYMAPSFVASTYDGAYAANDGIFEASHNDVITVAYQDCKDGDNNPANNFKTDVATYNAPPIVINEVLFHPDLITDTGATNQAQYEYVQLFNASAQAVNLTGYRVSDGDGFSYTVPEFTPGSNLVLQPADRLYIVLVPDSGAGPIVPGYDSANNAYYVYAQVQSLPPVRGSTLTTTAGSALVTDTAATFITNGVAVGDAFVIATGSDAGNYTVVSVNSQTQLTLSRTMTASGSGISYYAQYPPGTYPADQLSDPDNGINLATTAGSPSVTSTTATFITNGVQPGDPFIIANGPDAGTYVVASVPSQTTLILTKNLTATRTGLHYTLGGSSDQISLYNASGTIVDYVAWSTSATTTADFKSDDNTAINAGIWTDNSFKNVDTTDANGAAGLIAPGEAIYRAVDGKDSNQPGDWLYLSPSINMDFVLTLAVVDSVRRYLDDGVPVVEWVTDSEVGTIGYRLYRSDDGRGAWSPVTSALLPASPPSHFGAVHRLRDPGSSDRRQWYLVEELDVRGRRNTYGPFPVDPLTGTVGPRMTQDYTRTPNVSEAEPMVLAAPMAMRAFASVPATIGSGSAIRLRTSARGLYFVSAETIAAGLDAVADAAAATTAVADAALALSHRNRDIAYLPDPGGSGLFFFAEASDAPTARDAVYWLKPGTGRHMSAGGVRRSGIPAAAVELTGDRRIDMDDALALMQRLSGLRNAPRSAQGPAPAGSGQYFSDSVTSEQNLQDAVDLVTDPDMDFWLWGAVLAVTGAPVNQTLPLSAPAPATGTGITAFLEVTVLDASETDNAIALELNGASVGTLTWRGETGRQRTLQTAVPSVYLDAGGVNALSVTVQADAIAGFSAWYLNRVTITYPRAFIAENDTLFFSGGSNDVVTIAGFSSPEIRVFDISRPEGPVEIIDTTIDLVGTHRVSFRTAGPEARYLATVADTARTPTAAGTTPDALTTGSHGADYVIIAPAALADTAQALADHRTSQGLSAAVVTLETVMDAFNAGIMNPEAIRAFLRHARAHWSPAPRYVVLAGKGTYDYTDSLGLGTNLMPPKMVGTPDGIFASDNWLADTDGNDGIPEVAIGRLPARTAAELAALIQKIISYEGAPAGTWNRRILLVADNADNFADFAANSDAVAQRIAASPYQTEKFYLNAGANYPGAAVTLAQARLGVAGGFNAGSLLINYVGHGGVNTLAGEGIFTSADVAGLVTHANLPILSALTCIVNRFEIATSTDPAYQSLGERLLLSGGGAIAVWGPTGLSANAKAEDLNIAFMDALMGAAGGRLGDVVVTALGALGRPAPLASVYTLLGDPALRLPTP